MAQGTQASLKTSWYLLGPAFVAAIAYVDPGNVAANVSSGTQFGYLLLWVIVAANVMAGLVQYLSAKLGLVTGRSLPEAIGKQMSRPLRLTFWAQAEIVAMATDVAEVIGGAIALRILFGLPLPLGGVITGVISLLLLTIKDRRGQLLFERVITGLLLVIAVGFAASFFVATPPPDAVIGGLVPRFRGTESVLLAAAILGATVMPHAVYLHSGLALDRHGHPAAGQHRRWLLRVTRVDVVLAMAVAGTVNAAMLLVAAINLQGHGTSRVHRRRLHRDPRHAGRDDRGAVRDRTARVRLGVGVGGRLRRRDDHAGIAAPVDPDAGAPVDHAVPGRGDPGAGLRPDAHAGALPGRAVLRYSVRGASAGQVDQQPQADG